jgi:phosphoribosylamine--glycine ligase
VIRGVEAVPDDVLVLHAGTERAADGVLRASGGRVLGLVGRGPDLAAALSRAYAGVAAIHFDGMQYRRDIGRRGMRG